VSADILSCMVTRRQYRRRLVVESASLGLGYTAVLVWIGSALVGSFTDYEAYPYWPVISRLRTDTAGFIAFAVAIVTLVLSRYLQLRRRAAAPAGPARPAARPAGAHLLQALADTAVVLGTGLVLYLSMNEVTHPVTLRLQLTHLLPGPSEGTVRVIGLAVCLAGATVRRYLRASADAEPEQEPEPADQEKAEATVG
jgi:hypothetical protein